MRQSIACPETFIPRRIIHAGIVGDVKPHELVRELVRRAGGALPTARAMGDIKFQGTLYKFCAGDTKSPARGTAERIAKHFGLSVEALYVERVATAEAKRLGVAIAPTSASSREADLADAPDPRNTVIVADMLNKASREDYEIWAATILRDMKRSDEYSPDDVARFEGALRSMRGPTGPAN